MNEIIFGVKKMNQTFGEGFWATVELLVGDIKDSGTVSAFNDEIEDWLDTMAHKVKQQRERARRKQKFKSDFSESDDSSSFDYGSSIDCRYYLEYLCCLFKFRKREMSKKFLCFIFLIKSEKKKFSRKCLDHKLRFKTIRSLKNF